MAARSFGARGNCRRSRAGAEAIFSANVPSRACRGSRPQAGRAGRRASERTEAIRAAQRQPQARRRRGNIPVPRAYRPCSAATAPLQHEGRRAPARSRPSTCRPAPRPDLRADAKGDKRVGRLPCPLDQPGIGQPKGVARLERRLAGLAGGAGGDEIEQVGGGLRQWGPLDVRPAPAAMLIRF